MSKRKVFGCSFPLLIVICAVLLIMVFLGIMWGPIGQGLAEKFPSLQPIVELGPSWIEIEKPEPSLSPGVIAHIGEFPITNTMLTVWITVILLILLSLMAFRKPKIVPSGLQNGIEFIYNALLDFCISVAGEKDGRRFFPFVATIFLFIITNAWMGLLPFYGDAFTVTNAEGHHIPLFRAANTDINVPLALALFAWVSIETFGIRANGFFKYIERFFKFQRLGQGFKNLFKGKIGTGFSDLLFGAIDVFVGILEFVGEFIRIVSFTFRLFGNMTAGEVLIVVVGFLAPLVLGFAVYGLETFVGFIQALIFGGLTLVWMTMAVAKHEENVH